MDTPERDAIQLSPRDNVATVLRPVEPGERLRLGDGTEGEIVARDPVPLCHKIALAPIAAGEAVLKYGHPIGEAVVPIAAGAHVHVHNMRSARAKADDARPHR